LNAFCRRLATAAAGICRSTSSMTPCGTGVTEGVLAVDSSVRSVSMSCSRNRGTPVSSSTEVARGAALDATFARLLATIALLFVARNWDNMPG
jgi:hypothetical protein